MMPEDPVAKTGEVIVTSEHEVLVKDGRREWDWRALLTARGEISLFFWLFGMFLDEHRKPSMSRIMLAIMTFIGWKLFFHEINLASGQPSIQNAVWTAWWAAEGFLAAAVFVPSAALNYFTPGAAGTVAAAAIGSAARDAVVDARRAKAVAVPHDPDDPKSEYTP
jgi:hypothetical protein